MKNSTNKQLSHPHDINLFTDVAPSVSFGGLYGRWLAANRPPNSQANTHSVAPSLRNIPNIAAAILWGHEWSHKSILIYSDNLAVVDIHYLLPLILHRLITTPPCHPSCRHNKQKSFQCSNHHAVHELGTRLHINTSSVQLMFLIISVPSLTLSLTFLCRSS